MFNNENNIVTYDITKLKNNLNRILEEQNITQAELAKRIGMHQSGVSTALDIDKSNCFTVAQLACIAIFLGASVDDLLGIEPTENKKNDSLMDVVEKLFEISDMIPIEIMDGEIKSNEIPFAPEDMGDKKKIKCLYFKNDKIENILKTWDELNNCSFATNETKKEIIEMWKNKTLEDTEQFLKKWNFKNKKEQGKYIAHYVISGYYDYMNNEYPAPPPSVPPFPSDNMETLKDYMNEYAWHDLDDQEYSILEDFLEKNNS